MKFVKILSLIAICVFSNSIIAQTGAEIEKGEILKIGSSENFQYSDIKFPRANFIIKSGGRPDYSRLQGVEVVVSQVKKKDNSSTVILKRRDGKKFFGSFSEIKANYKEAIASGELLKN